MADKSFYNRQNIDAKRKGTNAEPLYPPKKQRVCCAQEKHVKAYYYYKRKNLENAEPKSVKRQKLDGVQEKGTVGNPVQVAEGKDPTTGVIAVGSHGHFASSPRAITYSTFGQTLAASSRQEVWDAEMKNIDIISS